MLTIAEQQDWRCVLRVGVLPHAPAEGLESLARALREGDPRLIRRHHVEPLYVYGEMPVAACCPLVWLAWRGRAGVKVGDVDDGWQLLMRRCEEATGSKLAAQSVIDAWDGWGGSAYDDVPLPDAELLEVVEAELARRAAVEVSA